MVGLDVKEETVRVWFDSLVVAENHWLCPLVKVGTVPRVYAALRQYGVLIA
jgi:hypothetical protein